MKTLVPVSLARNVALAAALSSTLLTACSSNDDDGSGDTAEVDTGANDTNDGVADGDTNGSDTVGSDGVVADAGTDGPDIVGTETPEPATPDGLRVIAGVRSVPESIGEVQAAATANEAITALDPIDHAANASSLGETLRPTTVLLFGNPTLGTPLMVRNRLAGLDLPQKILAFEDAQGTVKIAWNSTEWLAARHALDGVESLPTIAQALENLGSRASGATPEETAGSEAVTVSAGEGILTVVSTQDFETTWNDLKAAIESAEPLRLVAEVDHSMNATNAGLELPPTRLIVFGNPNLGTPLMQSAQTIAIDLPQKMLVFEDEGVVTIAWNDPAFTAARHGITDQEMIIGQISAALDNLAAGAAGPTIP